MLPTKTALICLARTGCINAAITDRSMQELGLAFALAPALRHLYPEGEPRARAFARYSGHSNTHAFMAPLFVGILLFLECQIARGSLPENSLTMVRETVATALSALGDSFFSGTIRPLWALGCVCLLLSGHMALTAALTGLLLFSLQVFRVWTFFAGLRHGLPVLLRLKRLKLINWVGRLKMVSAGLTALAVWQLLSHLTPQPWLFYVLGAGAVLGASWLVGRLRLPRVLLWALTLGVLILVDAGLLGM